MVNVLILGSGGREHTLAWKIAQSPNLSKLYIAPGNGGTHSLGENVPVQAEDFPAVRELVLRRNIRLVVVGPEAPLVAGIYDYFREDEQLKDVSLIGPSRAGAMLEGSKHFAKEFMERHKIPTALHFSVDAGHAEDGISFMKRLVPPYVLKADGLAAGKGVLILDSLEQAEKELQEMLGGKFGKASQRVVIEEFMKGIEVSLFVLTDGENYLLFPEAKDYKRIGEGDTGLNTGGMGAVSPVPFAGREFIQKAERRIIRPTILGLKKEKIVYRGFLYFGLMNINGDPFVVEYNVRLGDPETQVVVPRVKNDLLDLLLAAAKGKLDDKQVEIHPETACTVVMSSGGYPGDYEKGKDILNIEKTAGGLIFHAGTKMEGSRLVSSGGRVLAITALGKDRGEALTRCYKLAGIVDFEGKYFRNDIGYDLELS